MEQIEIVATTRTQTGKNACRRLRAAGLIPGILYGQKTDPVRLSLDPKRIWKILNSGSGANTLCSLKVDGGEEPRLVMIKDYQLDPVTHTVQHADLIAISMESMLTIRVPIHLKGEAKGVKTSGGSLEFTHREVEVECLPTNIPDRVEVDVSELEIGDSLKFGQVALQEGLVLLSDADEVIVHIAAPRVEEAPAPAAEEELPEEPEVIGKKKKEEEEAAAEEPAGKKPPSD